MRRPALVASAVVLAVAAGAAVLNVGAVGAAPRPDKAEPPAIRAVSWNICGEAGGKRGEAGFCPFRNEPGTKMSVLADLAERNDLNVLLLQEVCGDEAGSHLDLLQAELGPEWHIARADGARPDGRIDCRGDLTGSLGVGIAVKAPITETTIGQTLPEDPTGENKATLPTLCVRTSTWPTRFCTTHVLADPADPRRGQQIENIRDYVWPDRDNVVLGGDFNLFPDSELLRPISEAFDECDRRAYGDGDETDEFTHHAWTADDTHVYRKRDHIFATKAASGSHFTACDSRRDLMDTTPNETDSGAPNGYSDHAPLVGFVRTP